MSLRQFSAVWFLSSPVKGISHGHSEMTSSHTGVSDAGRQKCNCIFAAAHGGYFVILQNKYAPLPLKLMASPHPPGREKIGPKKGKHHRELLSRTIETEAISVPPPSRDSFAIISSHIIN